MLLKLQNSSAPKGEHKAKLAHLTSCAFGPDRSQSVELYELQQRHPAPHVYLLKFFSCRKCGELTSRPGRDRTKASLT